MGMALVTGFAGCKTDDEKDALDGTTWVGSTTVNGQAATLTLTCTSPDWLMTMTMTMSGVTATSNAMKGTYSVSGDTVSITVTHMWDPTATPAAWTEAPSDGATQTATLSGNTLTIPGLGVFTKR
jgi:hypothetical protein